MDCLIYFAASIFWRAAAHDWGTGKKQIDLGPYEEGLRTFLLGESDLPRTMAIMIGVVQDNSVAGQFGIPRGGRGENGYFHYHFDVLGITFDLLIGRLVRTGMMEKCSHRSPERFIRMGNAVSRLMNIKLGHFRNAELRGKLKELIP